MKVKLTRVLCNYQCTHLILFFLCSAALNAGQVGLALSYAITLMGTFQWGVRQSAEVENLVTFTSSFFCFLLPFCSCDIKPQGWDSS